MRFPISCCLHEAWEPCCKWSAQLKEELEIAAAADQDPLVTTNLCFAHAHACLSADSTEIQRTLVLEWRYPSPPRAHLYTASVSRLHILCSVASQYAGKILLGHPPPSWPYISNCSTIQHKRRINGQVTELGTPWCSSQHCLQISQPPT